jgi:hypothetical protein
MIQTPVREIIGQSFETQVWHYTGVGSVDRTIADYEFWDQLRRGLLPGYEFGSLFCNPMIQIVASYVLGDGVEIALDSSVEASQVNIDYTNDLLAAFSTYLSNTLFLNLEDLYGLADLFVVLNSDGSISIPAPHTVKAEYRRDDYRVLDSVTITTRDGGFSIEDLYTVTKRVITVKQSGKTITREEYPNLIGRIPIVHLANDRGGNETHGRVLYDNLLPLFQAYNDLTEKGITGTEALGNPIPVISGLKGVSSIQSNNAPEDTETYDSIAGNEETRPAINLDRNSMLLLGEGAHADMLAPPTGFTGDTRNMLKALFLLLLDHSRIPEFVWGGAIASSRASAETQAPPFYTYIKRRRNLLSGQPSLNKIGIKAAGGLYEIADIWLTWRALSDRRVVQGEVVLQFDRFNEMDAETSRKWVEMLLKQGSIPSRLANVLSGLVDDPEGAIEEAREELEQSSDYDDFDQRLNDALASLTGGGEESADLPPADESEEMAIVA